MKNSLSRKDTLTYKNASSEQRSNAELARLCGDYVRKISGITASPNTRDPKSCQALVITLLPSFVALIRIAASHALTWGYRTAISRLLA